ncbi:uncharacterized protein [Spinacia oleracea]|uniref:GRF-type domain-containing protein n=1 Tax=Spinacia oleracea TaxID=3562 RepID=A0ABM3QH04_SPIOL|nr:uncharacterized protein LOC110791356 [Spinacia oleracea]XP_056682645.1 uncharacterized protein LOC130459348 [Spinacia oleracea]XP_056691335.1 uncharacterized protein LOC130466748 [Spinacia oleracea]XP_056692443.1 uncharacterized protein LOC130467743 [Spinacia oleracea]XP_056693531.1 uncharacterized protein LOC130468058 [Spinacia oleracea]XP_056693989.1 uncharacterized protein LOC130468967 [Spinacia oleracea]XP_056695614.1 uncharacterized protein LOC130470069 [Spinacia oleracea]
MSSGSPCASKKCYCGIPSKMLTSWTTDNPGRKFLTCKFSDVHTGRKGCGWFYWVDPDVVEWQRVVTNELVVEKRLLKTELRVMMTELQKLEDDKALLVAANERLERICNGGVAGMKGTKDKGQEIAHSVFWFVVGLVVCCVLKFVMKFL